jgi:hypothetical protein
MSWALYALAVAAVAIAAYVVVRALRGAVAASRGPMLVECPDNHETAAVSVDVAKAALSSGFGTLSLELSQCSRWPEKAGCGQECLRQIEAQPTDCMVRSIVARWYEGTSCVLCGKPLGEIDWLERRPALLSPDLHTVQWPSVAPERLPEVLATHRPVCYSCHVAETFREQHPELVTENPWKGAGSQPAS